MLQKLVFKPGINRENTNYSNEGGWNDMDKVRFRFGSPEKIGGWQETFTDTYKGTARKLISWSSLDGEQLLALGTNSRIYVNYGGQYYNITPLRATVVETDPFASSVGSTLLRVTSTNHGTKAGDWVAFTGVTGVGGISSATLIDPEGFQVAFVTDANNFTIDTGVTATSTATGGGAVTILYELSSGLSIYSTGDGWGSGVWNGPILSVTSTTLEGTGLVGINDTDTTVNVQSTSGFTAAGVIAIDAEHIAYTGTTSTSFTGCTRGSGGTMAVYHNRRELTETSWSSITVRQVLGTAGDTAWGASSDTTFTGGTQMRIWTGDPYGSDMVMAPRGGSIFYWTKDTAAFSRMVILRDSTHPTKKFIPHTVNGVMVSDVSRFIIALGANPYDPNDAFTDFDPMLVRWSHQAFPDDWIPDAENQAGEQRLSAGSYIMTAHPMKQEILVWTDAALYSMQYVGPPHVFRLELLMANLSIIGPNAAAMVNNAAYWMGTDKFYIYNGKLDTLPCSVQQYVFNDLAYEQQFQTFAGTNEGFNEIWWFYVSKAEMLAATAAARDPVCDKYVIYNHAENVWYYGAMKRTAWIDSPLYAGPLAATLKANGDGTLVLHEQGTDDVSTTGTTAITAYIQSTDVDIGDGHQFAFVTRVLPDISFNGSVGVSPEVTLSLYPRQNSGAPYGTIKSGTVQSDQEYSPTTKQYTVQQFTEALYTRVRGRQIALRIESTGLGVKWKLGAPRIDVRPDGRKS